MYDDIVKVLKQEGAKIRGIGPKFRNMTAKDYWFTKVDEQIHAKFLEVVRKYEKSPIILSDQEPIIKEKLDEMKSAWIVDPLSHGFSFIRDLPHYSVVISHLVHGTIQFGFVYDPTNGETFTALKDKGAFLNEERIKVSSRQEKIAILFDYYPLREGLEEKNLKLYRELTKVGRVKTFGSYAINYCYVACGRAEITITQNRDTYTEYAGKIIVEEAGGKLTDYKDKPLSPETLGILCANGLWHKKAMEILEAY